MKQFVLSVLVAAVLLAGCDGNNLSDKFLCFRDDIHGDFTVNDGAYIWEYSSFGANGATLIHIHTSESEVVIPDEIRDEARGKTLKVTGIGFLREFSRECGLDLSPVLTGAVKSISIPASVVRIGPGAFGNLASLTGITFRSEVKTKGNLPGRFWKLLSGTSGENRRLECIGAMAFAECTSLKEITLPSSVKYIGDAAFDGCYSLERLNLGDCLEEIGWHVAYRCSALEEFCLPERFANDASVKADMELRQKEVYKFSTNGRSKQAHPNVPLKPADKNGKHLATGLYIRTKNGGFKPIANYKGLDLKRMKSVAVIAHGMRDELKKGEWMCDMGDALASLKNEGRVDVVIYANWGNECDEGILNVGGHFLAPGIMDAIADIGKAEESKKEILEEVESAAKDAGIVLDSGATVSVVERMPAVGKLMAEQLLAAGFKPESGIFIGHSLGAHLLGYIAKHYFNGKVARHVGLDTAVEYVVPPKYHVWGDAAQRTEFYKTSVFSSTMPYAQENYQLINIKKENDDDIYEGIFKKHSYAYRWFTQSITNSISSSEGYLVSPERYKERKSETNEDGFVEIDVNMIMLGRLSSEPKGDFGQGAKSGETKTITLPGGAAMEMIYVAPGTFTMGSPASEDGRYDHETQHQVTLTKGFWLGKYEVTQAQWRSVMGNNPSHFNGDNLPVESVSWEDCQMFIQKLNAQLSCGARLPTEAEWEYACRAGTTTAYFWGSSLNGDKANCDGNYPCGTTVKGPYRERTAPVGSYAANPWGFFDMHGNVWEWCSDWCWVYPAGSVTDPMGSASGDYRIFRGGSWYDDARSCRSARREGNRPGLRDYNYGFRLCCSAGPR